MAAFIEYLIIEIFEALMPYMEFAPGSDFGPIIFESGDCGCKA